MKNTKENVAPINRYEGLYEISNYGVIYSLPKVWVGANQGRKRFALSPDTNKKYAQVWLYSSDGEKSRKLVHRLVAEHFVPGMTKEKNFVNHIDGDHFNNSSYNLEWVSMQRNNEHAHAKHYNLISPDGDVITVYNLNKFCKDNNLNQGNMSQVTSGKYLSYKGWMSAEHDRVNMAIKPFSLMSQDGEIFNITNSAEFCRKHNLSPSKISLVKNGKRSTHKGWKLPG